MKDSIYIVDPTTRKTVQVAPTSFFDLNVKERADLQSWLMLRPEVLGEPFLLITSEFDRFDKSDKRLDLLLLDRQGKLVVAELKLDASGTLADQQAIRYAAFCSTMTMEDVVGLYARATGNSIEKGAEGICEFLDRDELPELTGEPRVLLAAGSFVDQELTTTVMWLRKFGLDISCVELTPYRYPGDDNNIMLVPKVLIPLTEAREYQVSIERKERSESARDRNGFSEFFQRVLASYASLVPAVTGPSNPARQDYMSLHIGHGHIHYEWLVRKRTKTVDVALHFESHDQGLNMGRLERILTGCADIEALTSYAFSSGAWGQKWAQLSFKIPYQGQMPGAEEADVAARLMNDLVNRTIAAVRKLG